MRARGPSSMQPSLLARKVFADLNVWQTAVLTAGVRF